MTKRTTIRLTLTIERIEHTHPSSGPFRAARRVIDTTGETIPGSELPTRPVASARSSAQVIPFRRAG